MKKLIYLCQKGGKLVLSGMWNLMLFLWEVVILMLWVNFNNKNILWCFLKFKNKLMVHTITISNHLSKLIQEVNLKTKKITSLITCFPHYFLISYLLANLNSYFNQSYKIAFSLLILSYVINYIPLDNFFLTSLLEYNCFTIIFLF